MENVLIYLIYCYVAIALAHVIARVIAIIVLKTKGKVNGIGWKTNDVGNKVPVWYYIIDFAACSVWPLYWLTILVAFLCCTIGNYIYKHKH